MADELCGPLETGFYCGPHDAAFGRGERPEAEMRSPDRAYQYANCMVPTIIRRVLSDRIPPSPMEAAQAEMAKDPLFQGPVRMIRSQEWKLVWRYPSGPHELYNVAEDPEERVNLFGRPGQADRVRSLRRELDDWFASYVDPELDGSRLPVTGRGQRDHATKEDAFAYRFPWLD